MRQVKVEAEVEETANLILNLNLIFHG